MRTKIKHASLYEWAAAAIVLLGILFLISTQASALGKDKITADTKSGPLPLTVLFSARSDGKTDMGEYRVDFGDGVTGQLKAAECPPHVGPGTGCEGKENMFTASHTYTKKGNYAAILQKATGAVCLDSLPGDSCAWKDLDSVTIRVSKK